MAARVNHRTMGCTSFPMIPQRSQSFQSDRGNDFDRFDPNHFGISEQTMREQEVEYA